MKNEIKTPVAIAVNQLHEFEGHPFKVLENDEMNSLIESIHDCGVLSPLIVRAKDNMPNEYEIISGHRRFHAAVKAGLETVPAFIYVCTREEAVIMLVDSNLHREHILPSEKAFAYKMKYDAMKHQGALSQNETKLRTDEAMGANTGESRATVQRYIRLTNLIPEFLDLMDEGKMAFSVGVELSYLDDDMQYAVLEQCEEHDCTPSYSQAWQMHSAYRDYNLSVYDISQIMSEEKANQREKISLKMEDIRKYFPSSYTPKDITEKIIQLLERDYERKQKSRNDAR